MKLDNQTEWDTKELKELCKAVMKHEEISQTRQYIKVIYKKRTGYSEERYGGYAYYNRKWVKMTVPRPQVRKQVVSEDGSTKIAEVPHEFNAERFAQVLTHELGHNRGLRHKDMPYSNRLDCKYVKDFKVGLAKPKKKPKRDLKQERYDKVLKQIKSWETKKKRAENALKKYNTKKKYYERTMELN